MFSSIGWFEIAVVVIIGIIIVGPERMPRIIEDVRAAIFAARRAINNAKAELNGELGEDFKEFQEPMAKIAKYQRMGPRGMISSVLFDGDEELADALDPRKPFSAQQKEAHQESSQQAQQNLPVDNGGEGKRAGFNYAEIYSTPPASPHKSEEKSAPKITPPEDDSPYGDVI